MSRLATACPDSPAPRRRWHRRSFCNSPAITSLCPFAFSDLEAGGPHGSLAEVVANALSAFVRLVQLKKTDIAYAVTLAARSPADPRWPQGRRAPERQRRVLGIAQKAKGIHLDG